MNEFEDDGARDVRTRITLRDHEQLRRTLERIADEGWNGPTGRGLLEFIRQDMIRPMVVAMGLRGTAAGEAEGTGWAAAWESLCDPRLVEAELPWSLVHARARHAVLGEVMAARYASSVRGAWRIRDAVREGVSDPKVVPVDDLTRVLDQRVGHEDRAGALLDAVLRPIWDRLVKLGWDEAVLSAVLEALLDGRLAVGPGSACSGWRPLAAELGVPPWRVRRLAVVLLGGPRWPGMIEQIVRHGSAALESPSGQAALETTVLECRRSPTRDVRRAATGGTGTSPRAGASATT